MSPSMRPFRWRLFGGRFLGWRSRGWHLFGRYLCRIGHRMSPLLYVTPTIRGHGNPHQEASSEQVRLCVEQAQEPLPPFRSEADRSDGTVAFRICRMWILRVLRTLYRPVVHGRANIGRVDAALAENFVRAGQAACSYSRRIPPRRSRLRISIATASERSLRSRHRIGCMEESPKVLKVRAWLDLAMRWSTARRGRRPCCWSGPPRRGCARSAQHGPHHLGAGCLGQDQPRGERVPRVWVTSVW